MKLNLICLLLSLTVLKLIDAQALPELPQLPSASPAPSPSPFPSALAELLAPSPSPSAATSTAIPALDNPGDSNTPKPTISTNPLPPLWNGTISDSQPITDITSSSSPLPSTSPKPNFLNENGICMRDMSHPQPKLGKSQSRYAVSVLLSAAAVAAATMFYGVASDWEPDRNYLFIRICSIVIARLLIIGTVKVSAALVASITKSSPDDSALDASGAFLTWGSAIFTRIYYEGIKMTLAALDFTQNESKWDDRLKDFFSVTQTYQKVSNDENQQEEPTSPKDENADIKQEQYMLITSTDRPGLTRKLLGGNLARKLLLLTAILYLASEIATLVTNVMSLLNPFLQPTVVNYFSEDNVPGQCGIRSQDRPVLWGVIAIQIVYAVCEQPSLVPLLAISAFYPDKGVPEGKKRFSKNCLLNYLRLLSSLVVLLWVVSLLVLPLFSNVLQPFFTAGDITLFWYVIIAPPAYETVSYIITATFTCFTAMVAIFILYGISKHEKIMKSMDPII